MNEGVGERLERSPDFGFIAESDGLFFVHRSGCRIRTDALGRATWESLPGARNEVLARAGERLVVPKKMARDFIDIMVAAGIAVPVSSPSGEDGAESGPARAETSGTEAAREQSGGESRPAESISGGPKSGACGLVSAVVVTYRGEAHIRACLSSLLAQTCREVEIIVIDNASRDRTAEIVAREFPDVRLVRVRKNLHYAGGVNRGLREARGEYYFILNDDTEVDPLCLEILRRRLVADDRAAAAVPVMRFFDLRHFVNGVGNHIKGRGWGSDNFIGAVDLGGFSALSEVPSACFGAVLIRRKAFEDTGLVDRGYTAYYEDVDWSFRARLRGWRVVPCGGAVVYHKFGGSWKPGPHKLRLVVRNRLRLVLKLFWGKTKSDYLKSYVKEDMKTFLSLLGKKDWGSALVYPEAYVSLLASLPLILWLRLGIMRRRDRGMDGADLPGPAEGYPILTDDGGNPLLDAGAYFRHYIWACARGRRA
jgi:GT2 family glycosyltransferase